MSEIFICYRRTDSEGYAGRLHDRLQDHFGARAVFVDVDNLHPGVDFEAVIQRTLLRSTVVLVVIGPRWLDQRLKSESDYVRQEIIAALKGRKRLIPVLVGDAKMPSREKLPAELSALAGKNAVTLRHPTWATDVARLLTSLDRILGRKKPDAKSGGPGDGKPTVTRATASRRKPAEPGSDAKSRTKKRAAPEAGSPANKVTPRPKKNTLQAKPKPARQAKKPTGTKPGATTTSRSEPAEKPPTVAKPTRGGTTPRKPAGAKVPVAKRVAGPPAKARKR
jgi:hypothetical protein